MTPSSDQRVELVRAQTEELRRRLAAQYERAADIFERSAQLAEEHAELERRHGHVSGEATERQRAKFAHDAAWRARQNALRLVPAPPP